MFMSASKINIKNKKAFHDYEVLDTYTAGMVLTGTEIKSIRRGKAGLRDAYCFFRDGELWVKGLRISAYDQGSYNNHDPGRERKLLLNRHELKRLEKKITEKGLTIIVLRLFISKTGYAKVDIALARGKGKADKRETLRRKDMERQMDRALKQF